MFEITCFSNILNRKPYPLSPNQSAEELWKAIIAKYQKPIKAGLYTSLLFYGTADEKAAAESRLKELSGKSLHTSKEWLDYSRRLWSES